jgi:hypothetical protein
MSVKNKKFKLETIYYLSVQHSPLVNQYTIYNACTWLEAFLKRVIQNAPDLLCHICLYCGNVQKTLPFLLWFQFGK